MKEAAAITARREQADVEALLNQAVRGDRDALEALYRETRGAVFAFALSILKSRGDAEDVLQDTFLNISRAEGGYRPMGKPLAWMLTIAKHLSLMKLRDRARYSEIPEESWALLPGGEEEAPGEDRAVIEAALSCLSDEERQIVTLHAVAGFKHREIAAFLELPLSTVLSKNRRALNKLRSALAESME